MRLWILSASLMGCGAPISNAAFVADAAFVRALPSAERFAAPGVWGEPPFGPDPLLVASTEAVEALDVALAPLLHSAAALAEISPDSQGPTWRSWEPTPVQVDTDALDATWWVRGTVREQAGGGHTFALEVAAERDGAWAEVATGRYESSGSGVVTWRGDVLDAILARPMQGVLRLDHVGGADPAFEIRALDDLLATDPSALWAVEASGALRFTDTFALDDGPPLPGVLTATKTDDGGCAEGVLRTDDGDVAFGSCWDASGETL